MRYAVAVQNTEDEELSLMGPYETRAIADLVRKSFVSEMDARYGLLDVYSVWVVPMRDMNTEMNVFHALYGIFYRSLDYNRTLDNDALDV